jgi:alpha-mannosidase
MKPVKQKNEIYAEAEIRLEAMVDALMYHPHHRRGYLHNYQTGVYIRRFRRWRNIFRKKFGTLQDFRLWFCGVSHLDAAWLFPVVDTKERAYKTFYKAVEHCKEFPFFTFAQTTPQYYDWIRCYDPKLWTEVKDLVKAGRIELTGGMWVEPDLDMPCGEALVRQRLYGQLFFLREFGYYPTMESLLDVFGFPWSLPQILVKSGATSFWTTKCAGSMPVTHYYWRGIDGSEIFSFQFPYNWDSLQSSDSFRRKARYPEPGHEGTVLNSSKSNSEMASHLSKDPNNFNRNFAVFYGLGDGGRGPMEIEIIFADSLAQLHHGKHTNQHYYMEMCRGLIGKRFLIWDDEMFLHMHHGTKTTQSRIKANNRIAESRILSAEPLFVLMNMLNPGSFTINKTEWFGIWQKILFNQFHDILPGSSIPDVYVLARKEQTQAIENANALISRALNRILCASDEAVIYNSLNWFRSEYLDREQSGQHEILYLDKIAPFSIQRSKLSILRCDPKELDCISQFQTDFILENDHLRALIRIQTGTLISLIHKQTGVELISCENSQQKLGAGFRVFKDLPQSRWKAWDIDKQYAKKKIKINSNKPAYIVTTASGERRIRANYSFGKSQLAAEFGLRPKDTGLRLQLFTDLRDPQILVKYFLPLRLNADKVTAEIPYGAIARPRIKRTETERLKWETCMQKWIDISDPPTPHLPEGIGLTITNNNRYGFSATRKGIYLTLTRTAEYPGISPLYGSTRVLPPDQRPKFTDMEPFEYYFRLIPHVGTWQTAHTWRDGYNLNTPLVIHTPATAAASNKSELLCESGFILIDQPNLLVGALKPSEWCGPDLTQNPDQHNWSWDGKTWILRIIEQEGTACSTKIHFMPSVAIQAVIETDLLEQPVSRTSLPIQENTISVSFTPWEIKTFRIHIK